ncbi:hypothetical protein MKW98_012057 [Papaver atlanticum]|uniref:separase n=1 Tax=Papaver atlanticum TaxID=357466 RepID=A0AAD4SKY9_9MAGN|nr:hypothetical protein MKW98_012057 [Papaver atlanticum]
MTTSSTTEQTLITRLETSDYKNLYQSVLDYLLPFSDFISLDEEHHAKDIKKSQKNNTKKINNDSTDPLLIRPLAKQFLSFLSRALKILPNQLSVKSNGGGVDKDKELAVEFFDIYRLCLNCLSCVSSCLEGKPFSIQFQRMRLVRCLEVWERYEEAQFEGFYILECLRGSSSGVVKGKKIEERFIPDLGSNEKGDPELANLILEVDVSLVKCAYLSQSKNQTVFQRVLAVVDQAAPWYRVLDTKSFERLHKILVTCLYKCTRFMLAEDECFEGELVHNFCTITLTQCLKSYPKDQFLKFAHNIFASFRSQWASRPALILDILQLTMDSILCECKVDVDDTVNEFLDLVHYCVKKCRAANADTCNDVAKYLDRMATKFVQVAGPIDSILRLYATGSHFMGSEFQSRCSEFSNSGNPEVQPTLVFLHCSGKNLKHLPNTLDSLSKYFHIHSKDDLSSVGCVVKDSRNFPRAAIISDLELSNVCKHKHGKISLLSHLNAMEFFCKPFTELVTKARVDIFAEKQEASFLSKICHIRDAFHQFCTVFFISYSTLEKEKDRLYESCRTLLSAAMASFIISLGTNSDIQKSVDCIDRIVSMGWLQYKEMQFLISLLYNTGAYLYNAKQLKMASVSLDVCCIASWSCVSLLCSKFTQKSEDKYDDLSEEIITGFVNETFAKSVVLLDVLHHCGSPHLHTTIVNSLSHWSLARNIFGSLSVPAALLKKWVKIIYKDFMDAKVEDNAPTLYSLLSKSSSRLSKETLSIILEQELLTYEETESLSMSLSKRMQLKIVDILLLDVYTTDDNCLQRSKILIKKGRVLRTSENEGLNGSTKCVSEAISNLINVFGESSRNAQVSHQLALAYCIHALCVQESQLDFEVISRDIHHALKLWSSIKWSVDVHGELLTEQAIPLLCTVADLLSLKGCLQLQNEMYKLIIKFLKRNNVPAEQCLTFLWADRRLTHALCPSPVHKDFVEDFELHFGVDSSSFGFWVGCLKDSPELLIGFRQRFSLSDSILGDHHCRGSLGSHETISEVKEVTSALVSRGSRSAFVAGYLYYDLSERFISNGQLFEALSYAIESLHLRTKLLQKKFRCTLKQQPMSSYESGETTSQHERGYVNVEVLESVSTEVWPLTTASWTLEGSITTQWNVLQCYLESVLQVGAIHEATGNVMAAEALFLQGKHISCTESLPIFTVAFASALGEIYGKKQNWDLAERELNQAKQILADSNTCITCKRCRLALEVTVYQRIGDLTKNRMDVIPRVSSINSLYSALDLYKSALKRLKLPEWDNSLSFLETDDLVPKELGSLKGKSEGSHVNLVPKKSRKPKTAPQDLAAELLEPVNARMMTRSRYRSSHNNSVQLEEKMDLDCPKNSRRRNILDDLAKQSSDYGCEACKVHRKNCWRCLLLKVSESGKMNDFIYMKWEFYRRRLQLKLLIDIGYCIGIVGEVHETHEIFWQSISALANRNIQDGTCPATLQANLLEFIEKASQGDVFAIERATVLYHISWFSLKNYHSECTRINCCGLSCIQIPKIVSWLMQAFVLCREVPLLFQKVSRLLAVIFLLSSSDGPFCLPHFSGKVLTVSHWAAYFHQASVGTYLSHQFLSKPIGQPKNGKLKDSESSHATGSTNGATEACNLLRVAPERIEDLENFVTDFFQQLPSITVICLSLLGDEFDQLLRDILPSPSFLAWILVSRLTSSAQPVVMILPADLILEDALDDVASSGTVYMSETKDSSKKWRCPWGNTVVDDVAPQFKLILEENFVSSLMSPSDDTQENRVLWWSWRRKLNDLLEKFLRSLEESWLGPWKCLLLGEPSDCRSLNSVLQKLLTDLKCKCGYDANKTLLRVMLGGAGSIPETEACVSQFLLNKNYIGRGGCWDKICGLSDTARDVDETLLSLPRKLILEAFSELGNESIGRQPIVLVLDSEIQMLPWENLPVLRKHEIYRMPSVGSVSAILNISWHLEEPIGRISDTFPAIDPLDGFYLLNPGGDLERAQVEFEDWFRDQKFEGKAGTAPPAEELVVALENHDLFIYIGHGSGAQYIPSYEIQKLDKCAATLLMGCSSGCLSLKGCYNPQGAVLSYLLAGSPAIIANLWEVTDKDIDRFGKAMLNAWLQERSKYSVDTPPCDLVIHDLASMNIATKGNSKKKVSKGKKSKDDCTISSSKISCSHKPMIGSFMSQAREACTLPVLIGASPVCYGVPTSIRKKKDL